VLRFGSEEARPAHRGELRVLVSATRPAGLRQVRPYLAADLIRRYAERIGLTPTVADLSPEGEKELRAACDALNIHPPRHTLTPPPRLGGLFPDGVRAPVFDLGVQSGEETLPEEIRGLAGRWIPVPPAAVEAEADGLELGQEPLSVRMKMLGFEGNAVAALGRWRARVAGWARSPSGAMSRSHAEAIGAAFEDGLDSGAALRVLADLEADDGVPDGVKFETFAAADRMFGLDLARDIGR
jgi:hypothetical protein